MAPVGAVLHLLWTGGSPGKKDHREGAALSRASPVIYSFATQSLKATIKCYFRKGLLAREACLR